MGDNIQTLEIQEVENELSVENYTELLASYLLKDDLCYAKFLWKRIPVAMKQNPELAAVWTVGQKLWLRDMPAFYTTAQSYQWSEAIMPIMTKLIESMREKMMRLIGTAYTSIQPNDVCALTGLNSNEVSSAIEAKGWTISDGMINPREPIQEEVHITPSEDQLAKLTDFVACLEN